MIGNMPRRWWRRLIIIIIIPRLCALGSSTALFLHLAESALHTLHIVVDLRWAFDEWVVRVDAVTMDRIAIVVVFLPFFLKAQRCQRSHRPLLMIAVVIRAVSIWGPGSIELRLWRRRV
jgi:hypothetical protein